MKRYTLCILFLFVSSICVGCATNMDNQNEEFETEIENVTNYDEDRMRNNKFTDEPKGD